NSSAVFPSPPVSVADRDYFIALRERDTGMFFGRPVHGRILADDIFNVAQRRSDASGRFDGVIVVSALPSYFTSFWRKISRQDGAMTVLSRHDGAILARVPPANVETPPFGATSPFMRAIDMSDSGTYRATSLIDGQERIVAFEKISDSSLYVGHGRTVSGILQTWHHHMVVYAGFFAIGTFGLVLLAVVAERRAAREAAAVHHWRKAAQQLTEEATHRAAIEAQLHQAQKMEAFGQFAGGMAHDFNNILHVITGSLDMLKDRAAPGDKPLLALALDAANRGSKTIASMLAFARQQPLQSEVFDLNATVCDMESLLRPALGSGVKLDIVPAKTPCWVRADRNQTELAILNLALNARDAMPAGGTLLVTVSCVTLTGAPAGLMGDFGAVAVKDTGVGMSPEVQARLSEPFFTTKGPGKGTGLGLSMVYGFAEQSHGAVTVDSAVGQGTTMVLYLPFSQ
ncbi:MAG: ATP-binding protein, partial [Rhodopila sp.]|nr:ATP-binding protein [Rhodopila sp.]